MHLLIALTIQTFAGLLLLLSALSKLRDVAEFERLLGAYEILPRSLLRAAAVVLPVLELALAGSLLVRFEPLIAARAGAAMLVVFGLAIAINLARGRSQIDCGCHWGASEGGIARWMVVRNLLLALGLGLSAVEAAPQPIGAAELWTIGSASLVFLCLYHALPALMATIESGRGTMESGHPAASTVTEPEWIS